MPVNHEQIIALLKDPCRETYVALWEPITSAPGFNGYSRDLEKLGKDVEAGNAQDVLKQHDLIAKNLLSPRLHMILAAAHRQLGNSDNAGFEAFFATACVKGIMSTGDGSFEQPYLVTRTSDEYDVMTYLEKKFKMQTLLHDGDRTLDRLDFQDGTSLHFDISRVYASLLKR